MVPSPLKMKKLINIVLFASSVYANSRDQPALPPCGGNASSFTPTASTLYSIPVQVSTPTCVDPAQQTFMIDDCFANRGCEDTYYHIVQCFGSYLPTPDKNENDVGPAFSCLCTPSALEDIPWQDCGRCLLNMCNATGLLLEQDNACSGMVDAASALLAFCESEGGQTAGQLNVFLTYWDRFATTFAGFAVDYNASFIATYTQTVASSTITSFETVVETVYEDISSVATLTSISTSGTNRFTQTLYELVSSQVYIVVSTNMLMTYPAPMSVSDRPVTMTEDASMSAEMASLSEVIHSLQSGPLRQESTGKCSDVKNSGQCSLGTRTAQAQAETTSVTGATLWNGAVDRRGTSATGLSFQWLYWTTLPAALIFILIL